MKAAADNLKKQHLVGHTEIETYHLCALKNWQTIVKLAGESTAIFGMIDVGDYFDVAVQSLALLYHVPYIVGGTFAHQMSVDFLKPEPTAACACCLFGQMNPEIVKQLVPAKIAQIQDLSFIPRNDNPIGQSNVYLASICSEVMVARLCTYLLGNPELDKLSFQRLIFFVSTGESVRFEVPKNPKCLLCNPS